MDNKLVDIIEKNNRDLLLFYTPYFENEIEAMAFIEWVYQFDWDDRRPRQMLNQVYHFVTLAKRIDEIWPPRDGLRVIFLKACLESLCYLSGQDKTKNRFYSEFAHCFSDKGSKHILSNFCLSGFEHSGYGIRISDAPELTMGDFLELIKVIRDRVVHEGDYWSTQLFASDNDSIWITHIETDKKDFSWKKLLTEEKDVEYHFTTTLQYEDFLFYFVEASINHIKSYIHKLEIR